MIDSFVTSVLFWPVAVTTASAVAAGSALGLRKLLRTRRIRRGVSFVADKGHRRLYQCGHTGPSSYRLLGFGKELGPLPAVLQMNFRDTCPKCQARILTEITAKCSLCGRAILPEEPVAVYRMTRTEDGRRLDGTKHLDGMLGCLDWDCSLGGSHFAGHWTGKGVEEAFENGQTLHDAV